jgi:hypothetical protein
VRPPPGAGGSRRIRWAWWPWMSTSHRLGKSPEGEWVRIVRVNTIHRPSGEKAGPASMPRPEVSRRR